MVSNNAHSSSPASNRIHVCVVTLLLVIQAGLLAYSATQHSPTDLEPAFLVSGISHWEFGRFESYRVNPPLVRMVAALPVLAVGYKADWTKFLDGPGARTEFPLGEAFIKANGKKVVRLFVYARWACIPFSLLGAFFTYRWATELYSPTSGIIALTLFVFEPNLLAHGELITPDAACTAFGILAGHTFWRWLKQPTWSRAALAGGSMGLAELSKMSWLILFGLWPLMWLIWRWLEPKKVESVESNDERRSVHPVSAHVHSSVGDAEKASSTENSGTDRGVPQALPVSDVQTYSKPGSIVSQSMLSRTVRARSKQEKYPSPNCPVWESLSQLTTILVLAIYLMNLAYAFDGTGTQLKEFQFVSTSLTGLEKPGTSGNRFRDTWLGSIPMPLPNQYILGFDSQKKDFERFAHRSFLRGEWKDGGWWYYYLYGLLVKVPCGTWALMAIVMGSRMVHGRDGGADALVRESNRMDSTTRSVPLRDELVLLLPALALLALVSSQTEFNIHLRYVFPALGMILILIGQAGMLLTKSSPYRAVAICSAIVYAVTSCMLVYPNHLAHFNDFVGGPAHGHKHLLGSSLDWGQGTLEAISWIEENEQSSRVEFFMHSVTLAKMLHERAAKVGDNENSSNLSGTKLVLYSADRYSDREKRSSSAEVPPTEDVIKRFISGSTLVRLKQ